MHFFRKIRWLHALLIVLLTLAVSSVAWAQRSDGNIGGEASPGDKVVVRNIGSGFKREIVVNDDGMYRVRSVPVGEYQIIITRGERIVLNAKVTVRPGGTVRSPTPPSEPAVPAAEGTPTPDG